MSFHRGLWASGECLEQTYSTIFGRCTHFTANAADENSFLEAGTRFGDGWFQNARWKSGGHAGPRRMFLPAAPHSRRGLSMESLGPVPGQSSDVAPMGLSDAEATYRIITGYKSKPLAYINNILTGNEENPAKVDASANGPRSLDGNGSHVYKLSGVSSRCGGPSRISSHVSVCFVQTHRQSS